MNIEQIAIHTVDSYTKLDDVMDCEGTYQLEGMPAVMIDLTLYSEWSYGWDPTLQWLDDLVDEALTKDASFLYIYKKEV